MPSDPETLLLYGETNGGKTSQLGEIAQWEFKRTGRISRLISADSNWDPLKDLVITPSNPKGIIQAIRMSGVKDPWSKLVKMSEGCWAEVRLLPGGGFNLLFPPPRLNGDRIVVGGSAGVSPDDTREVGQYFLEGLTTIAALCLQDHADHADSRRFWGTGKEGDTTFDSSVMIVKEPGKPPVEEKTKIGRAVGGHYGSVQSWMIGVLIPRFSALKLVDRVVWTSHTGRGKDDITEIAANVLGPNTVGQASVDSLPQKFGHTLLLESEASYDAGGNLKQSFRAWYAKHPDKVLTKMEWPAKVSLTIEQSKELMKKFPKGYIPLDGPGGLGAYLDFLHPEKKPQ